jgi:hypothetical protein
MFKSQFISVTKKVVTEGVIIKEAYCIFIFILNRMRIDYTHNKFKLYIYKPRVMYNVNFFYELYF